MQLRLWIFILLVACQFVAFIFMVLLSAGVFNFSKNNLELFLRLQLTHQRQTFTGYQSTLTVKGIRLADQIERQINDRLAQLGVRIADLNGDADQIANLLAEVAPTLRDHVLSEGASGTFVFLDVSNQAANPGDRAGLLLRNLEPNSVSLTTPNLWLKYGPFEISKQLGVRILPQWRMEFTDQMNDLYQMYRLKLGNYQSRAYSYQFTSARSFGSYEDRAMYLLFPLRDAQGSIYGICGFEINAMLFKLSYINDTVNYPTSISLIAPQAHQNLLVSDGLIAAQTPAVGAQDDDRLIFEKSDSNNLLYYRNSDGEAYMGLSTKLELYPETSPFYEEAWSFAVILPQKDFLLEESDYRMQVLLWTLIAFAITFILLVLITLLYMRPIRHTLHQIVHAQDHESIKRTGILEIDDLLLFLKEKELLRNVSDQTQSDHPDQTDTDAQRNESELRQAEIEAFRQRVNSLSPAEKAVFDLYLEGHNAREITEILHLSINTIKTHNKRIYMKLDVGSRRELLEYVYSLEDQNLLK